MKKRLAALIAVTSLIPGVVLVSGCGIRRAIAQSGLRARLRRLRQGGPASPDAAGRRATAGFGAHETAEIAGLKVSIWRPSNGANGPAALVIFSHGFHGSSTQSTFLMNALAGAGYLVIAPNHKDARGGVSAPQAPFGRPELWSDKTYKDRADDITGLLRAMKKDPAWSSAVDWNRVGLAGHSLGGYTVLGLAGAWPSWKLPEAKAVLALSPYCSPFAQKRSLGALKVPVMYQGGTLDFGVTPSVIKGRGAYQQTASPASYVEYSGAGHFAWTDINPKYQASIDYYCIAFFDKYLRGDAKADPTKRRSDISDLRSK